MQPSISFWNRLKEISLFLQGNEELRKALWRVTRRLGRAEIPYAVVGDLAVHAHGGCETTAHLELLLTPEGLAEFRTQFVPKNYATVEKRPRRFVDRVNQVSLDILVTGRFPGSGSPGPVAFPDPQQVCQVIEKMQVVDLPTLITLKLAARRYQDFADVVQLIGSSNLDKSFQEKLDPSVRRDYIECLEEKRREDEYEERQDQL